MDAKSNHHFIYILQCNDGTFYTGYTTNIERRMSMHEQGKGAKYTRGRAPFRLKYQQECQSKSEALQLEAKIKKFPRSKKIKFMKEGCVDDEYTKKLSR